MLRKHKKLLTIAGIVSTIIIILNIGLIYLNTQVQNYLENVASKALGVDVRMESLRFYKLPATARINNLTINNIDKFSTPHLIKVSRINVNVKPTTLLTNIIEVNDFDIENLEVNIEQKLSNNNVLEFIESLKSETPQNSNLHNFKPQNFNPQTKPPESQTKLKLNFQVINIENTQVNLVLSALGVTTNQITFDLPNFRLTNVSSDNLEEILVSEFIQWLVQNILENILRDGGGKIPNIL